ncbi:MAG: hypothetical protein FJ083_17965 [Cyanobacteria bacterium K_Offshore_surface_m2_239]|nr:hypothetical protein [Cyanobacteria bacterium K_Offshore_surface_m2_239]
MEICLFRVPYDLISEIIIGMDAKKELEEKIIQLAWNNRFRVYKVISSGDDYSLRRVEISVS